MPTSMKGKECGEAPVMRVNSSRQPPTAPRLLRVGLGAGFRIGIRAKGWDWG